jgi:hypothetical protein
MQNREGLTDMIFNGLVLPAKTSTKSMILSEDLCDNGVFIFATIYKRS